jgi:hypothetical protein
MFHSHAAGACIVHVRVCVCACVFMCVCVCVCVCVCACVCAPLTLISAESSAAWFMVRVRAWERRPTRCGCVETAVEAASLAALLTDLEWWARRRESMRARACAPWVASSLCECGRVSVRGVWESECEGEEGEEGGGLWAKEEGEHAGEGVHPLGFLQPMQVWESECECESVRE